MEMSTTTLSLLVVLALAGRASAQPPQGGGGGGGGGGGTTYQAGVVPQAASLRGTVGVVDTPISSDKTLIYGPFEVIHRTPPASFCRKDIILPACTNLDELQPWDFLDLS